MMIFRTCSPVLQEGPTPGSQVKGDCPIHTGPTDRSKGFCPTHTGRGWLILFFLAAMFQGISASQQVDREAYQVDREAYLKRMRLYGYPNELALDRIRLTRNKVTPLDHFSKACNTLGNFSHNGKQCKFKMREHRSNWWKLLGFPLLPFTGLSRNILRAATLAGWTRDTGNPVLKQGYFFGSRYYEVVRIVRRFDGAMEDELPPGTVPPKTSILFQSKNRNLTCLECRQVESTPPFVSVFKGRRNPIKLFHLSRESRCWLDAKFKRARPMLYFHQRRTDYESMTCNKWRAPAHVEEAEEAAAAARRAAWNNSERSESEPDNPWDL